MTQPQPLDLDAGPDWQAIESALNFAGQRGDVDTITVIDGLTAQRDALVAEVERLTAENQRLAEACEARDIRIWLIEQTLQPITATDDPVGIVGELAPWLDGPIHPDHVAAYHAATALEG